MNYTKKSFSVAVGSNAYRKGWDRTFEKKKNIEDDWISFESYRNSPKRGPNKIKLSKRNIVKCMQCGEILESKSVHDFKICSCSNQTMVDGGHDYRRWGGANMSLVLILQEKKDEIQKA
jgi:hypothetical protein